MRYIKKEAEVREITNDVFLKVFTAISTFDGEKGSFATWLRTIAVRTCLDRIRQNSGGEESEPLTERNDIAPGASDLEAVFSAAEILYVLNQLPPRQSSIFSLFVVEGYSHDEIGKLLNISPGNARWYLNDAKRRLKGILIQGGHKI